MIELNHIKRISHLRIMLLSVRS